jgi:tRNA threonylcarbamoyladenosine biosynthesis protein TsaB
MALILSLETSAKVCSAAIHNKGELISSAEVHIDQSHASKLAVLISEVMQSASIQYSQLDAIATTSGPGSYTGLRIGTSMAKGLAVGLSRPIVSMGTLELLAHQVAGKNVGNMLLCPMIDARRMEVYCSLFNSSLEVIQPTEAKIIDELSFQEHLKGNQILFFGDGASKCKEKLTSPNAKFITGIYPAAAHMGTISYTKFVKGQVEDVVNFEPHYLKEFMIKKPAAAKTTES